MWRDDEVKVSLIVSSTSLVLMLVQPQCVHYVLDKPWMERPSWENEAGEAVKVTHSWWWDAKDRLERRIKGEGCLKLWEMVGPYLRVTVA